MPKPVSSKIEPKLKYAAPTRKPINRANAFKFNTKKIIRNYSPIRIRKENIDFTTARTLLDNLMVEKISGSNLENNDIFLTPIPPSERAMWGTVADDDMVEMYDNSVWGGLDDQSLLELIDSLEPKYNIINSPNQNKDKKPIAYIDLLFFSFLT